MINISQWRSFMKKIVNYFLFSILASLLIIPTFSFPATRGIVVTSKEGQSLYVYKEYHALVVGISEYEWWPKLPNAVNDAKEVAEKLKEMGFKVKLVLDPTSREMETALNEMVYKMGNEENRAVLFYYAGHGETEALADNTKMGYIIPRDCPLLKENPLGFATHAISMRDIESVSLRIRSKHVLMFFDSCFSGSLFALIRAVPHDISEKSTLPVRQYITAGREDEQVPDRSMFKRCFLIGLGGDADLTGDGYITGSEMGMYLSDKVINYTHRRQHPQYGKINNPDLDRGDFIFVPLKVLEKAAAEERKVQEERSAIAEELKMLREERGKSEESLEQMKQLLEAKSQLEEKAKEGQVEKEDLEKKLKRAEEELKNREEMADKIKELDSKLLAAEEKQRKELDERKRLEVERESLKADKEKLQVAKLPMADKIKGLDSNLLAPKEKQLMEVDESKAIEEKRLAYITKEVKDAEIPRVKLREVPKKLELSNVRSMVYENNFFEKSLNPSGDFPNDFVDNGDGSITDRATGLMWEQAGSSSALFYYQAKKYVSRLNEKRFLGYDDWRIPTLEELCSLLERDLNEGEQHINPLLKGKQAKYWSNDLAQLSGSQVRILSFVDIYAIVNFAKGKISDAGSKTYFDIKSGYCSVKPVRTIE